MIVVHFMQGTGQPGVIPTQPEILFSWTTERVTYTEHPNKPVYHANPLHVPRVGEYVIKPHGVLARVEDVMWVTADTVQVYVR